ncbi:MAG: class II glutamine amidotransferase [Hyphomicrobiaceae bacterium]
MCRVLMYKGEPVSLDHLLYLPNNSLIRQAYQPQMLEMLSLAGFGMLAWDRDSRRSELPYVYRSTAIPLFDANLKALARKLEVSTLVAHVRGIEHEQGAVVGPDNLHPFQFPGHALALAHNGYLAGFERMRFALLAHIEPEIARLIRGNVDSEWIYALFLSQLGDPKARAEPDEIVSAVERTLKILREVRHTHGIAVSSPLNLFITDGRTVAAVRFTFDFGCFDTADVEAIRARNHAYLGAWYTKGASYALRDGEWKMSESSRGTPSSLIVSSEPLTRDTSTWLEVPEYSAYVATDTDGTLQDGVKFLDA